jgi:hypothetical protein
MEDQPGNWEESCMTCKPYDIPKTLIWEAWLHVKANQGAAGIDTETIERFETKLGDNLYKLWNRMSSGSYIPPPVKAMPIPKKSGGVRILGIPTVADRVAQTAVKMWLEPRLDPIFCDDSYGYRPGKSALEAIAATRRRCWDYDWVVEFDIRGLFDNLNHGLLMKALRKHCQEPWILLYVERWLKAPMQTMDGQSLERDKGTPQGGVAAPRTQKITFAAGYGSGRTFGRRAVTWSPGQGNAVPDDNLVIANEDFLHEKPKDPLTFRHVKGTRRRSQSSEERAQRFGEAQVGCAVG